MASNLIQNHNIHKIICLLLNGSIFLMAYQKTAEDAVTLIAIKSVTLIKYDFPDKTSRIRRLKVSDYSPNLCRIR